MITQTTVTGIGSRFAFAKRKLLALLTASGELKVGGKGLVSCQKQAAIFNMAASYWGYFHNSYLFHEQKQHK